MDSNRRERPEHETAGRHRGRDPRTRDECPRDSAPASRTLHVGRIARCGGPPRGSLRVSARNDRADDKRSAGGRCTMAHLRIPEEDRTITEQPAVGTYLAERGIAYERLGAEAR